MKQTTGYHTKLKKAFYFIYAGLSSSENAIFVLLCSDFPENWPKKQQGPGKFRIPALLAKKSMLLKVTDGQFENAKVKSKGVNCGIRRLLYFELQVPGASHWARQGQPVGLSVIDKLFSFGVPVQLAS